MNQAGSKVRASWLRYVQSAFQGNEAVCESYWQRLEVLYAEPQRHYHNMFHMELLTERIEPTLAAYRADLL